MSGLYSSENVAQQLRDTGSPVADGAVDLDSDEFEAMREERTRELLQLLAGADDGDDLGPLHDELVLLNVEIAESVVMRYRNRGVPVDDLVQVACLGLVKAARGFDPAKSDNFLGYAVPTILGEVKRFFRDHAWTVRPPRRIQELQAEISATGGELTHELGRAPSAKEIAESLELDPDEVAEAMAADGCFSPSSLDRPTGDGAGGAMLAEVLGGEETGYDQAEAVVALAPACRTLSDRDRRIIYLRFFHEWTQARIAKEFGVTQMQVSRLLTRILKQLRTELGSSGDPVEGAGDNEIAS